jgi:CheY-like chemotaxis protein
MFESTILVVDDEVTYCDIVGEALRSFGFNVHTANNAAEASRLLEYIEPDLIIMDNRMPKIDGVLLLKELRANPEWARTPIIMASADPPKNGSKSGALEAGPTFYLTKPFTIDTLRTSIQKFLPSVPEPFSYT